MKLWKLLLTLYEQRDSPILSIAIMHNGNIVTGSNKTINIWNSETGACINTIWGHNKSVSSLAIMHNGNIVSGSFDKTVKIWNPETWKCNQTLDHEEEVKIVSIMPDGKIISVSNTINIWNNETWEHIQTLYFDSAVYSMTIINNNKIATACSDETILIWDIESGEIIKTICVNDIVYSLTTMPDGKIVSGTDIWDIETGEIIQTLATNTYKNSVYKKNRCHKTIVHNGYIVFADWYDKIIILDIKTGEFQILEGHEDTVTSLSIMDNGNIVSCSCDATIKIWGS